MSAQKIYKRNSGVTKINKKMIFEAAPKSIEKKEKKANLDGFDYSSGVTLREK